MSLQYNKKKKQIKFGSLIYVNNPLIVNTRNTEEIIISGRHWFSINLDEETNFFSKIFAPKCCQCNEINQNVDVDIEHLDECNVHPPINIYTKSKNINPIKDIETPILDISYQDYILDLGDDIYLHEQSEIEEVK